MTEQLHKLKLAEKLAGRSKISRRQFVQLALAAGFSASAGEIMFTKAARAEPKKGGNFRVGISGGATTDVLDPAAYNDQYMATMGWGATGNSLTEVNTAGEIVPDLAESFESADGMKSWIFRLRNGVTFHNGKDVTADDVVASFRHHMGEESKSAAKALLSGVEDIKADGKTVIFKLKAPHADFPVYASDYHLPIMPSVDGKADWQSGVKTGPFKIVDFQPGVNTKLVRNENYYGDVWFDECELLRIPDAGARASAIASGELHYMERCDLRTLSLFRKTPGVQITEVTGYGHFYFPMLVNVAPFDNVDVRLALKYAIDRQAIVDKVLLGHAIVGNDNPIAPNLKYAIDPEPRHTYDPDKVKFHLKRAGMESLKVDLHAAEVAFPGAVDAALLYKDSAAKAGIDINVIREADDAYWDTVWMKKPFSMSFLNGRATVDWMFQTSYAADAAWNDTFWKNPKFNELLIAARGESDEKKRAEMYADMQQILAEDGGTLVLNFNKYISAHSDQVAHGEIAPNWDMDGMKITSRWWFA